MTDEPTTFVYDDDDEDDDIIAVRAVRPPSLKTTPHLPFPGLKFARLDFA